MTFSRAWPSDLLMGKASMYWKICSFYKENFQKFKGNVLGIIHKEIGIIK